MIKAYEHSVKLDKEKCTGCTTCIRHCPTEAIRIRDGHAVINSERCIDCGECILVCPHHAKRAVCGNIDNMQRFKYKIALPAPTLYGQFANLDDVDFVLNGLKRLGFDEVYEVSKAAEIVTAYTRLYLKTPGVKRPVISSACPAIKRLIGIRYPSLLPNIMHLLPPMEIAAKLAKEQVQKNHPELKPEEIGACFISPCPAKVSSIRRGFSGEKSMIDEVASINDVYFLLLGKMTREGEIESLSQSGMIGIGWATSGGESTAILNENYLAADGIDNVINVLDQIENGNIPDLDFIELNACTGGCVGGAMTVENPFVAKARLQSLRRYLPVSQNFIEKSTNYIPENFIFKKLPEYRPINELSDNFAESLRMMADIEKIKNTLPGYDCGSCGAPTCRAFAEDIVTKKASIEGCLIMKGKKQKEE